MSGVDKIIDKINEDAKKKAEQNLAKAKETAKANLNTAKKEAEQKSEQILTKAKSEAERLKQRLIAIAELEARKTKLSTRQDIISEAFDKAIQKLVDLPDDQYRDIIADMVIEMADEGKQEIVFSKRDKDRFDNKFTENLNSRLKKKGVDGKISISDREANFKGGFILKRGKVELNNSFETIIRMNKNQLEEEIVGMLFKQD